MLNPHWGQVLAIAGSSVVHREQIIISPQFASTIINDHASMKWRSKERNFHHVIVEILENQTQNVNLFLRLTDRKKRNLQRFDIIFKNS
jgi:hypothetical protein